MYSPKELEGEVDHSFFDSDCEANGPDGFADGQLNKQKSCERQEERTGKERHFSKRQIEVEVQTASKSQDEAKFDNASKQQSRQELKENIEMKFKSDRQSDVLIKGSTTLLNAKSSETINNRQSDEGSSVHSYSSDEERKLDDFKHRKTNGKMNSDDDGYHHSDNESEEDVRSSSTRSTKHKGLSHGTPRKLSVKFRKHSRSRSSSSDPESSQSSEERRSQKSPAKRGDLAKDQQKETAESEDTVTDVTPLSTPNISPAQSIDVAADVQEQQPGVDKKMLVSVSDSQDSISSEGEDGPVFLKVGKQLDRLLVVSSPGSVCSSRKNFSFTNEEVRDIDRENQRLLRELSRPSTRSRTGSSACSKASSRRTSTPPVRLYHSAVNRQREQERIQKENLAFLKRLESVKATPGMTRDEQLADYQRQSRYLGTSITAVPPVRPKSSRASGRTSRRGSSPHKARPDTAKLTRKTPRPAWS